MKLSIVYLDSETVWPEKARQPAFYSPLCPTAVNFVINQPCWSWSTGSWNFLCLQRRIEALAGRRTPPPALLQKWWLPVDARQLCPRVDVPDNLRHNIHEQHCSFNIVRQKISIKLLQTCFFCGRTKLPKPQLQPEQSSRTCQHQETEGESSQK